ncbi:MAG TPA: cupin domain-containing protein [Rhodanobacteraceae bacterium]|nr:cupin domain-containing protein [Rhodanobacteraceae bacterium]
MADRAHLILAEALKTLEALHGADFAALFEHGSLSLGIFCPRDLDIQKPHERDEVYVVIAGHGFFHNGDGYQACSAGDVLFVAAGVEHRFEEFSNDFATWVMFYGPQGGERNGK